MKSKRNCRSITLGTLIGIVVLVIFVLTQTAMVASAAVMPKGSVAVVTADTKLNLRKEPQGEIIGKIARGKTVTILSEIDRNGYYQIRVDETGLECYAYGEYLEILYDGSAVQQPTMPSIPEQAPSQPEYPTYDDESEESIPEGTILVVKVDTKLNMRKKPSRKGDRIQYLYNGEMLEVVSPRVKNNYVLVRDFNDGKVGYVSLDYVVVYGDDTLNKNVCAPGNCCQNCVCPYCQ